jgi:protein transport protein HofC
VSWDNFFRGLLPYLKASLSISEAIQFHGNDLAHHPSFSKKLALLVQQGYRLSFALRLLKAPENLQQWITLGEETGRMTEAIQAALALRASKERIKKMTIRVLRYPLILLFFIGLMILMLHLFIFPSLLKLYGDQPLPALTALLIHHSLALSLLLLFIPGVILIVILHFRRLHLALNLSEEMRIKLNAGLSLMESAPEKWKKLLSHGYRLSIILMLERADPFLIHLIKIGELTGNLQDRFSEASLFYQEKISLYLERLETYLPAALILIMGGLVGLLVMAIYLPWLQLNF